MSVADAEAYTDAVAQVSSGNWQQILWAHQQGIPHVLGMTTEEWVKERIGGYIRLSISDRREVVQDLAGDGLSQREIAAVVGTGVATVNLAPDRPSKPSPPRKRERGRNRQDGAWCRNTGFVALRGLHFARRGTLDAGWKLRHALDQSREQMVLAAQLFGPRRQLRS